MEKSLQKDAIFFFSTFMKHRETQQGTCDISWGASPAAN